MSSENITYETDTDGRMVKVHTSRGAPQDRTEVVREWNGLIGQEQNLLKELAICRARIASLTPVKTAIITDLETETETAITTAVAGNEAKVPEHVVDWVNQRREKAGKSQLTENTEAPALEDKTVYPKKTFVPPKMP